MSDVPGKTRRKHTLFIISLLCVKNGPNLIVVGARRSSDVRQEGVSATTTTTAAKTFFKKWIYTTVSKFIALIPCCSICQIWGQFLAMNSKGLYLAENSCLEFTSSRKREIRHFHVVVVQRRERNLHKSKMHVQSWCFAYLILSLFCRPRCRCRRSVDWSWSLGYFFSPVSTSKRKCFISASRHAR